MKFKLFLFIFLLTSIILFSQDEERNKKENSKKYNDYFNFSFNIKTEVEFGLVDASDDPLQIEISPYKNRPKITEELYGFVRINRFQNKKFIFGPYIKSNFEIKIDNKKINPNYYFFLEEFNGFSDIGLKIGIDFGRTFLKGSSISWGIPLYFKYDIFDKDNGINVPVGIKDLDFFTHLYIGIAPLIELKLRSKQKFIFLNIQNCTVFSPEIINTYYKKGFNFYFLQSNILKFSIAPFNYINEKIEIWVTLYNKFNLYYDSYNLGLKERAYFNIIWKGLQNVELFYKPIIYNFSLKMPDGNFNLAYDQENIISMGIGVSFKNKLIEFSLSYEPTLWAIDRAYNNNDSVKPHIFRTSFEFKY